jgi:hypothetical protein
MRFLERLPGQFEACFEASCSYGWCYDLLRPLAVGKTTSFGATNSQVLESDITKHPLSGHIEFQDTIPERQRRCYRGTWRQLT